MGGGHSWESCALCLSILFASTSFLFNTPIPASTSQPPNRRAIWGGGDLQVRNQGEDREVENGVRGDGYAQKPSKRPRKDLPVSGVTNSASFRPGEKRAIRGAGTCGSMGTAMARARKPATRPSPASRMKWNSPRCGITANSSRGFHGAGPPSCGKISRTFENPRTL